MATNQSTAEQPFQVAYIAQALHDWVGRLGAAWVEGELTSYNVRGGHAYATLRDLEQEASLSLVIWRSVREQFAEDFRKGDRVIVHGKPDVYVKQGSLSLRVLDMRRAGIGNLLEQLERLKKALAAEGLFDPARKRPLPFLPYCIGLVTGRDSDAEKDVRRNAELRWPNVRFRTEYARVQGEAAAAEVAAAVRTLDDDPEVDVIIVARGGGDFLHLLPFSDETLVRTVAGLSTPVVSAIGHEADRPLLDEVADLRASTPTDAAKRVVPDVAEQLDLISQYRAQLRRHVTELVRREGMQLEQLRSRPALANPNWILDQRGDEVGRLATRGAELTARHVERHEEQVRALSQRLAALSPLGTLRRGYAIVERVDGDSPAVVVQTGQVAPGAALSIRVTDGRIAATVE